MADIVDHRPAIAPRGARIAAGRNVEGEGQVGFLDQRPHRVEVRQVVVDVVDVMAAPDRFAGEAEHPVADPGAALDFGHGTVKVAGGDRCDGHHRVPVGAELLPGPIVPHAALGVGEHRVGRRPHGEALVRKDDLDVDPVALVVLQPLGRIGAGLRTNPILALEAHHPDAVRAVAFAVAPLHALLVGDDARRALAILLGQARRPQVRRLVRVAVGRDHEVFAGILNARRALPALGARRIEAPEILVVYRNAPDVAHRCFLRSCRCRLAADGVSLTQRFGELQAVRTKAGRVTPTRSCRAACW